MAANRIGRKNKEFDAVAQLARNFERLSMTPPVDDDYGEVRYSYESALSELIDALKINRPHIFTVHIHNASMDGFRATNLDRCKRWHPKGINSWSLSDWLTAVAGELGEAANVIKKMNRGRDNLIGNKETAAELHQMLRDEIADTFIYLDLLSQAANINLWAAVVEKFNAVSIRNGFPERL